MDLFRLLKVPMQETLSFDAAYRTQLCCRIIVIYLVHRTLKNFVDRRDLFGTVVCCVYHLRKRVRGDTADLQHSGRYGAIIVKTLRAPMGKPVARSSNTLADLGQNATTLPNKVTLLGNTGGTLDSYSRQFGHSARRLANSVAILDYLIARASSFGFVSEVADVTNRLTGGPLEKKQNNFSSHYLYLLRRYFRVQAGRSGI